MGYSGSYKLNWQEVDLNHVEYETVVQIKDYKTDGEYCELQIVEL